MSKRGDKVKKRAIYIGIVILLIILILFFVSKFVIKDFKEFFGIEFGFGDKEGRLEKSEVERALMAPGDVVFGVLFIVVIAGVIVLVVWYFRERKRES